MRQRQRVCSGTLLCAAAILAGAATALAQDTTPDGPMAISYKGITITPLGFVDLTGVYRSTNVGSGIGTAFGSIPFNNTPAGQLSETRFSAQNSRLGLRADGKFGSTDVRLYVEADFLGAAPANVNVTSNGNPFRMRLYWVDVRNGAWEVLAGQSWSFMTPNRNGVSPMPGDIFFTQVVDTNYQAGLTWTRAAQFRLVYHLSDDFVMGLALENPDQYIGAAVVLPPTIASSYASQLDNNNLSSSPNVHPDVIGKVAFDPKLGGHHLHVEAVGLFRTFRVNNPLTHSNDTAQGVGGSFNLAFDITKTFRLVWNSFYSDGGGRYIFGLAPDLVIRPDGTISPVHSGSVVAGFEAAITPTTNLYGYFGGLKVLSNYGKDSHGVYSGYGYPGSATNQNHMIEEGTIGFAQTFLKSPKLGSVALLGQYSYLWRTPFVVPAGSPSNAHTHMVYLDVRYTLP
jgi:hypothetical protein